VQKSPSPVHQANNPLEQAYSMYKINSNSSGTSLQKVGTAGSAQSGGSGAERPRLENRHSVQRKPVGSSRLSGQGQVSATNPPPDARWNPQRFSYESPPPPQEHGYGQPPRILQEQQAAGYGFSPPQGPPPPAHGHMPYRNAPQQGQQGW
jgi:hypothetical protein